ncbi:MAG: hypothetical protein Q9192_007435 [Flavoplaca navasiana]
MEIAGGPEAGCRALDLAIEKGHLDMVSLLLDENPEVDAMSGPAGWRATRRAAQRGFVDILQCLVQKRADVNAHDKNKQTPLFHAVDGGNYAAAEFLLQHGADPNAQDDLGNTPLHTLSTLLDNGNGDDQKRRAMIQVLCDFGADPNILNNVGETAVFSAIRSRCIDTTRSLVLQKSRDINIKNDRDETPLYLAIEYGLEDVIVELLRRGANLTAIDKYGMACLDWIKRLRPRLLESETLRQKISDVAIGDDPVAIRRNAYERTKRIASMLQADQMSSIEYYDFCTMLLLLDMDHDASLAYQLTYLHGRSLSDKQGVRVVCKGCDARQRREQPFYKCKMCPSTEFCHECMTIREEQPVCKFCEDHDFLKVVASEARILPDQPEAIQGWLLGIEERLKADDLEVESDHTPETVPS